MTDLATAFAEWARSVPHQLECRVNGPVRYSDVSGTGVCDCDWLTRVAEGAARAIVAAVDTANFNAATRTISGGDPRAAARAALREKPEEYGLGGRFGRKMADAMRRTDK